MATLRSRAERLAVHLRANGVDLQAVASGAAVGGGAAPGVSLPSAALSVPADLAAPLRLADPPSSDGWRTRAACSTYGRFLRTTTRPVVAAVLAARPAINPS